MGILDDALNSQDAKRSQRLNREAQKSKIEANKIKEGTYCGVDLVDGTALIQLDGQESITSGYRLITNAPLGDGDRVSLRPNGVGLPRADAKNVAPKIAANTDADILREATITNVGFYGYSGSGIESYERSTFTASYSKPLVYKYKNLDLIKIPVIDTNSIIGYGENVRRTSGIPATTPIIVTTSIDSNSQDLIFTVNLDTRFEAVTVSTGGGQNLPPTGFLFGFTISFPLKQWGDLLKKFVDYEDWLNPAIEKFYLWSDCPIEIDARGGASLDNASNFGSGRSLIKIGSDATATDKATAILVEIDALRNPVTPFIQPFATGTAFQFAISFRKRGKTKWFSLG